MKTLKITLALAALAVCAVANAFDVNDDAVMSVTRIDDSTGISIMKQAGFRPTSISAYQSYGGTTQIAASWVLNVGTHNKTFLYEIDRTAAQVNTIQNDGWNIEDVEVYRKGNTKYYAVLAFAAADQPNQSKWFDELTGAQVKDLYDSWHGRISDLDVQQIGNVNYYSGVMRKNEGAYKMGWYWHTAIAFDDIGPFLTAKHARVVDICERQDGLYSVAYWTDDAIYRYVKARSYADILKAAAYYGYRLQAINQTIRNGDSRYTGVIVNTKNDLTRKVGDLLRSTSNGNVGCYLKQVDGDVLADLQETDKFYPASTVKAFFHANAIWTTATAQLNTRQIPVWQNHTSNNHAGETPTMTALPNVVQPMMVVSSNQMANACIDFWGADSIESVCRGNFGVSTATQIRNKLGLGGPYNLTSFNETTLTDLGSLYENVGKKFSATKFNFFRNNMINDTTSSNFDGTAKQERDALGMNNTQYNAWRASYSWMAKAGSIPYDQDPSINGYESIAGWMKLPYKGRAGITYKAFVFGIFKDHTTTNTLGIWTTSRELMRDAIHESLATFKD